MKYSYFLIALHLIVFLVFSCSSKKSQEKKLSGKEGEKESLMKEKNIGKEEPGPNFNTESKKIQPKSHIMETSFSFCGWKAEQAIIRQEDLLELENEDELGERSNIRTLFFAVGTNGKRQQLDYRKWQDPEAPPDFPDDPPNLDDGMLLIYDFHAKQEFPKVLLSVDADPKKLNEMYETLSNWNPGMGITTVKAMLRIQLLASVESTRVTLWKKSVELGPYSGEATMEYDDPRIRLASISSSKSSLFVAIFYNGEEEDIVISIPPKISTLLSNYN